MPAISVLSPINDERFSHILIYLFFSLARFRNTAFEKQKNRAIFLNLRPMMAFNQVRCGVQSDGSGERSRALIQFFVELKIFKLYSVFSPFFARCAVCCVFSRYSVQHSIIQQQGQFKLAQYTCTSHRRRRRRRSQFIGEMFTPALSFATIRDCLSNYLFYFY